MVWHWYHVYVQCSRMFGACALSLRHISAVCSAFQIKKKKITYVKYKEQINNKVHHMPLFHLKVDLYCKIILLPNVTPAMRHMNIMDLMLVSQCIDTDTSTCIQWNLKLRPLREV